MSRIYIEEEPGLPQILISDVYFSGATRASDPYLRSTSRRKMESVRSLSRIYIEGKPKELQILIQDLFGREAKRASDPPLRSILKRSQESLRSSSQIYIQEKPGDPQLLLSDRDLREPGELQILISNLSVREFPDQYVRLILTRRQESLRSLSWIYLEEYPGERQTLMSDLYQWKTRRASHDYL